MPQKYIFNKTDEIEIDKFVTLNYNLAKNSKG